MERVTPALRTAARPVARDVFAKAACQISVSALLLKEVDRLSLVFEVRSTFNDREEATMQKLVISSGLLVTLLATVPASAEVWCLRTPGQSGGVCVFPSGRDCAQAASVSSFGGVCERQAPAEQQSKRRTKEGYRSD